MDLSGIEALRIVQRPGVDTEGREILAIVAAKARENGSRAALLHAPRTLALLLSLPSMGSEGCVCPLDLGTHEMDAGKGTLCMHGVGGG